MLECTSHKDRVFVTLNYTDEELPRVENSEYGEPTLVKRDIQLFQKKLRDKLPPESVRFYSVGEYGDETQRPHYHLAIFGYPNCNRGRSDLRRERCCGVCDIIQSCWGAAKVDLRPLDDQKCGYIAGYVLKKMTQKTDTRLLGREPEFRIGSKHPAIGADFMHEMASVFMQYGYDKTEYDVPWGVRIGSNVHPLGNFLRGKLRELVYGSKKSRFNPDVPDEVQDLLEASWSAEAGKTFKQLMNDLVDRNRALVQNPKFANKRSKI